MSTAESRAQNATRTVFDRREAVVNASRFGTPLPKGFINLPHSSDRLPPGVPANPKPKANVAPFLKGEARQGKNFLLRRIVAVGALAVAGGMAGLLINNEFNSENAQTSKLVTAGNVTSDPTVTMHAGEFGDPSTISGMIAKVDPNVPIDSNTYENVFNDVTAQLQDRQSLNNLGFGQKFEIPKVPTAQNQANR